MNGPAEARAGLPAPVSLAILVWLFGFFAFAGTTILGWHPVARMAGVLLYGVPVVAWAVLRYRRPLDRLDIAVVVGVLAHLLVSFFSLDRQSSMEMSAVVVAYAATFWIGRSVLADAAARRLAATAIVMALLFWLIVFAVTWIGEKVADIQQLGWPPVLEARQAWVWGSINTPPILVLLAAPFLAWLPSADLRRAAVGVWLAASVVVVPLSVGRAGWLGIGVAIASLEPLFGFPAARRMGRLVRNGGHLVWAAWLIPAAALAVAAVALVGGTGAAASGFDSRTRLWQQAMSLFRADPLTGAGPSAFPWARLPHVPDYIDRVAAKEAHSIPLQTLADGGLVLAVAGLLVVAAWASVAIARREWLDGRQRLAIAALIGYAAVTLLDDMGFLPAVTVLLILLAAWVAPSPAAMPRQRASHVRLTAAAMAVLLVVVAITAPSVARMTASRLQAAEGRQAATRGDWDGAVVAFQNAAGLHAESAQHWMSIGLAAGLGGHPEIAVHAYERARSLSPGDPRPWGALAALAADPEVEVSLLSEAARRSNDPRYAFRLGTALARDGDSDAAARAFALAVVLRPDWFATVPPDQWPAVRDAIPQAIGLVGSVADRNPEEARWNAGLAFGDLPAGAPAQWQAVQSAVNGDIVEARVVLSRAQDGDPNNPRTDQAARAVAWLACDRGSFELVEMRLAVRRVDIHAGDHPVIEGRAGLYRDGELGDYQPITGRSVPVPPQWPMGLIEVPDCGW